MTVTTKQSNAETLSQEVSSKVSQKYLKTLDELMTEMKGKSLVMILEDGLAYEVRLNRQSNKLALELKQVSEDRVQKFTDDKIGVYNRTHNVWTTCFSVAGQMIVVGVTLLGTQAAGQAASTIMNLADKANDGLARGLDRRDESDKTKADYEVNLYQTDGSTYRQEVTQGGQHHREMDNLYERVKNVSSELFRTIYSS